MQQNHDAQDDVTDSLVSHIKDEIDHGSTLQRDEVNNEMFDAKTVEVMNTEFPEKILQIFSYVINKNPDPAIIRSLKEYGLNPPKILLNKLITEKIQSSPENATQYNEIQRILQEGGYRRRSRKSRSRRSRKSRSRRK